MRSVKIAEELRELPAYGQPSVGDCPDWEDNRVLDLVVEVGALVLASADVDLTAMSPWRGVPILTPQQFAARVDGSPSGAGRSPG